jgi:hypothetical protein
MTRTTNIELAYTNWRFFSSWTDNFEEETGDGSFDGDWNRLIRQADDKATASGTCTSSCFVSTSCKTVPQGKYLFPGAIVCLVFALRETLQTIS